MITVSIAIIHLAAVIDYARKKNELSAWIGFLALIWWFGFVVAGMIKGQAI